MKRLIITILLIFSCMTVYPLSKFTENDNSIMIATFNIQIFGRTKSSKNNVMEIITKIVSKFDIIAIQEIQDIRKVTARRLQSKLKKNYKHVLGPRVGYSHRRKEQYAYFYNTNKVKLLRSYTYDDRLDDFSREPFIAEFKIKANKEKIVLINIHTPPKFATREIKKLPEVIVDAMKRYSNVNIILLGDLNADCTYFKENTYKQIFSPDIYIWTTPNKFDTTVKITDCTYDRIILTMPMAPYYYDKRGVFKFDKAYKLPYNFATQVSDHYPVWIQLSFE